MTLRKIGPSADVQMVDQQAGAQTDWHLIE